MIPPRNETAAATPILCISNSDRPKTPELLFAVKLVPAEGTRRSTALADIKEVKANVPKIKKKKKYLPMIVYVYSSLMFTFSKLGHFELSVILCNPNNNF